MNRPEKSTCPANSYSTEFPLSDVFVSKKNVNFTGVAYSGRPKEPIGLLALKILEAWSKITKVKSIQLKEFLVATQAPTVGKL